MMRVMPFLPLQGVRVLDLTSSLAGPTSTEILAALGADVVKVEHPGRGDEARDWGPRFFEGGSVMFFSANAGKRSLALDLKDSRGREALLRLAERSDVAVQSLRPGTAERLGIGPEELRERNPKLVYCTIGAFGRRGPLAAEPGYDPLMQAAAGIMSVTGEADRPPVRVGASLIDIGTGVWAALAIVAALHEGVGRTLDLSLYETALSLLPYQLSDVLAGADAPGRHGTAFPLIAPYEVFPTADGELMIVAGNDRLFGSLCEVLGAPELARRPALRLESTARRASRRSWSRCCDLCSPGGRPTTSSRGCEPRAFPPRRFSTSAKSRATSRRSRRGCSRSWAARRSWPRRSRLTANGCFIAAPRRSSASTPPRSWARPATTRRRSSTSQPPA